MLEIYVCQPSSRKKAEGGKEEEAAALIVNFYVCVWVCGRKLCVYVLSDVGDRDERCC